MFNPGGARGDLCSHYLRTVHSAVCPLHRIQDQLLQEMFILITPSVNACFWGFRPLLSVLEMLMEYMCYFGDLSALFEIGSLMERGRKPGT